MEPILTVIESPNPLQSQCLCFYSSPVSSYLMSSLKQTLMYFGNPSRLNLSHIDGISSLPVHGNKSTQGCHSKLTWFLSSCISISQLNLIQITVKIPFTCDASFQSCDDVINLLTTLPTYQSR